MFKIFIIISPLAFVCHSSSAQEATEASVSRYSCSMVAASTSGDGSYSNVYDHDDSRPQLVTVPADGDVAHEKFSDDGRYYQYVRKTEADDGSLVGTVFGTFDLRLETLSVSRTWFGSGKDDILRPYSSTSKWVCTLLKRLN